MIEHYVSLNDTRHFTGSRLTMNVAANAQAHHIKLAFENPLSHHFAHNDILLGEDAAAYSHSFLLGGAVLRHNTSTQLNGENTTLRINSPGDAGEVRSVRHAHRLSITKATATAVSCTKPSSAIKDVRCLTA